MSKAPLTMVIVDDDVRRESVYRKFFKIFSDSEFSDRTVSVVFCGSVTEAERAVRNRREPFVVMLDMVLSDWDSALCHQLEITISRLNAGVIAVSSLFSTTDATATYLRVLRLLGNRYLPIMHWGSLQVVVEEESARPPTQKPSASVRTTLEAVAIDLGTLLQWDSLSQRAPDQSVVLLHLSDLHFRLDAPKRSHHAFQIGSKLRSVARTADFVCVTGDSVNRGHTGGYDPAIEWIKGLHKNGCLNAPLEQPPHLADRVLICPGNHDFSEGLAISAYARRNKAAASGFEFVPADATSAPLDGTWVYGMGPFLRYHETLTGWRVGHGEFPGYRLVSRYASLGLHFVELWAEEYRCGGYPTPVTINWFRGVLTSLAEEVTAAASDGDCVVVLVHRFSPAGETPHFKEMKQVFGSLGPRLKVVVLSGHYHEDEVTPVPRQENVLRIQGGSIDEGTRAEDELAKIGIITLSRRNGQVTGCRVEQLERRKSGWSLGPDVDRYTWKTSAWFKKADDEPDGS